MQRNKKTPSAKGAFSKKNGATTPHYQHGVDND